MLPFREYKSNRTHLERFNGLSSTLEVDKSESSSEWLTTLFCSEEEVELDDEDDDTDNVVEPQVFGLSDHNVLLTI